jgi:hypothetical protein
MRVKGETCYMPFDIEVLDEYDLKKQIEIVKEALKEPMERYDVKFRDDILSVIAESIVRDVNVAEFVNLGEVSNGELPELPPASGDPVADVKEAGHDR